MAYDADLTELLKKCSNEDLDTLVQYITQKGSISETLSVSQVYMQHKPDHTKYVNEIIDEIQCFGGDSFANMARGRGVKYREIVEDVAKKMGVKFNDQMSTHEIEQSLIAYVIQQAWGKMKEEERIEFLENANVNIDNLSDKEKEILIKGNFDLLKGLVLAIPFMQLLIRVTGFQAYQVAVIVANVVSKALLGHGLAFAGNAALVRGMAVFAGPVGWLISGLLMLPLISGPAYRVTIPCVLHIAMLREKYAQ